MDNEKDLYIKEKLQNDKLISKNADDIINKFFDMEDVKMKNNNDNQNKKIKSKKILFSDKWKKILVTAASLMVIFGVANVYASTKGYGNIFFLIKYLITGENSYVTGKDEILTDSDITISYEPISVTENLSIIIKKIQIKDNVAKLFVIVNEKERLDSEIVPLKYKVMNDKNVVLCDQKSSKEPDEYLYTDELRINDFKETDEILKMEIYKANSEILVTFNIDLKNQTIEVVGEKEALSKISEIELKKFLNYVSGLSNNSIVSKDERLIRISLEMLKLENISNNEIISDYNRIGYPVEEVNELISNCFSDNVAENISQGETIERYHKNGIDYYTFKNNEVLDGGYLTGECININNISYCNGLYTVTYTFYHRGIEPDEDIDMNNYNIYEQTVYIKLNENNKYSKFKLVSMENAEIIQFRNNPNSSINNENNSTTSTVNHKNNNLNVANTESTNNHVNNDSTSKDNSSYNNIVPNNVDNSSDNVIDNNTSVNTNNNQNNNINNNEKSNSKNENNNNSNNEKIDNYASTMSWTEYWAPGLKFQYPTVFELIEEGGYYRGNNQGELTTRITGIAVGKNPDTNERIESKLMIKIYNPQFVSESYMRSKVYPNGTDECGSFENSRGIKWYIVGNNQTGETGYTYSEKYSNFEISSDGSYVENQIEFVTDNINNYKVRNIINWLLGSTQLTSW